MHNNSINNNNNNNTNNIYMVMWVLVECAIVCS